MEDLDFMKEALALAQKAFDLGCDKVVLLLTKPIGALQHTKQDMLLARLVERNYPATAQRLRQRAKQYEDGIVSTSSAAAPSRVARSQSKAFSVVLSPQSRNLTAKPPPTSPPMRSLAMAAALPDNDDTIYLL